MKKSISGLLLILLFMASCASHNPGHGKPKGMKGQNHNGLMVPGSIHDNRAHH